MSEDIFVNIEFEGTNLGTINQIQVFPSNIAWEDLDLMLKVYADQEQLTVKYKDEEGDEILISSQEELTEAFKVAKRCNNTLALHAICHNTSPGLQDGNICVTVDTMNHSVTMTTTLDTAPAVCEIDEQVIVDDSEIADMELGATAIAEAICSEQVVSMEPVITVETVDIVNEANKPDDDDCVIVEATEKVKKRDARRPKKTPEELAPKPMRLKAPKRGKKDHYAELATQIGKSPSLLHRASPGSDAGSMPKKHKSTVTTPAEGDETPPGWFFNYMDKFKKEITDDLAKLVARRTVHQVLKGLNNAVIDTIKVTDSGLIRKPQPATSGAETAGSDIMYCHEDVVCDHCGGQIFGIRYKCGNCDDYDLCEQCEAMECIHDSDHVFLKIKRPSAVIMHKKNGRPIPLLKTNLYVSKDEEYDDDYFLKREEKQKHRDEKLLRKFEKFEEKMRRKEEKLKRRLEAAKELPKKKEKLDLPQYKVVNKVDLEFLRDENIPDGTHVQPGTRLVKKWVVKNTGADVWDDQHKLIMMWGSMSPVVCTVPVPALEPDEEGIVTVELIAPDEPGTYQSHWRLSAGGRRHGHRVWCSIIVDPKETLEPAANKESVLKMADNAQEAKMATSDIAGELVESSTSPADERSQPCLETCDGMKTLMSYETLTIDERIRAKASQTATPNNTPRDVTPPKSPIPTLRVLSNSSSVEIVTLDEDETLDDEEVTRMTDLVQERMASLGLKPNDPDDDLESWSSCEEFQSDESDSDFYVVPIPDCFNPELPPTTTASTSIIIKKDVQKSIDEILTASHNAEMQPLLQPTSIETTDSAETLTSEISQMEPAEDSKVEIDNHAEKEDQICDVDVIVIDADLLAEEERPVEKIPRETLVQEIPAVEILEFEALEVEPPEAFTVPKVVDVDVAGAVGGAETPLVVEVDDQETDQNANLPLDINENSAGTPNQEEPSTGDGNVPPQRRNVATDPRDMSPGPGELAAQWVSAARGVASYASSAAQTAFCTAKDVFHTLQYTPPQSNWTPPQNNWNPKANEWTPPTQQWTPSTTTWTPPEPTVQENHPPSLIEKLVEMGFANREQNRQLLEKHHNDIDKVIQDLIQGQNSDWPSSRH